MILSPLNSEVNLQLNLDSVDIYMSCFLTHKVVAFSCNDQICVPLFKPESVLPFSKLVFNMTPQPVLKDTFLLYVW